MSKQDRQGVRTPADIERKYNLGKLNTSQGSAASEVELSNLIQTLNQFMADTNAKFEDKADLDENGTLKEEQIPDNILKDEDKEEIVDEVIEITKYVTPQMFGAKGDGVTDDTKAIQDALDGSSFVYIPDGVYLINGTNDGWGYTTKGGVFPRSNQTIILSNNAILKAKDNTTGFYNIININGVSNVHISGGKVQGNKTTPTRTDPVPGSEFGYGVAIYGSTNVTIEKMESFDCWGDSVFVGYSGGKNSNNVKVLNCVLHDSRRQGISVVGCENATIRDCEIYNIKGTAPQYGIDIEPDGSYGVARNIKIDNCHIHDNEKGSIVIANTTNEIQGVNITNCALDSVNSSGGSDVSIINCEIGTVGFGAMNPVRLMGSLVNEIYLCGGTGIVNNCDIVGSGSCIYSSGDAPKKKSNLYCNNCRFIMPNLSSTGFLIAMHPGDNTNGRPDETFMFSDCTFELGTNCYLSLRTAGKETCFDGCKIIYKWKAYEVFSCNTGANNRLVLRNTKAEWQETPTYLISVGTNMVVDIDICNCDFSNTANFLTSGTGSSGSIRLLNNKMNTTNFVGDGTFQKFISNDIDLVPTANSQNLITSGAVEEALKGFMTDGVTQEEFDSLSAEVDNISEDVSEVEERVNSLNSQGVQQTPLFANKVEECTDTSKVYVLPDGYIYGAVMTKETVPLYTDLAINFETGCVLNNGSIGYTSKYPNAIACTDYIPFREGDIVRIKGYGALLDGLIGVYNKNTQAIYSTHPANAGSPINSYSYDAASDVVTITSTYSNAGYLRISGIPTGTTDDIVITVNEEFKEEIQTTYKWTNTGHAFIPADYEARIIALEEKLARLEG